MTNYLTDLGARTVAQPTASNAGAARAARACTWWMD